MGSLDQEIFTTMRILGFRRGDLFLYAYHLCKQDTHCHFMETSQSTHCPAVFVLKSPISGKSVRDQSTDNDYLIRIKGTKKTGVLICSYLGF